jgi:hypothetical protein
MSERKLYRYTVRAEELLCGACAPLVARQFGLSEPGEEVCDG